MGTCLIPDLCMIRILPMWLQITVLGVVNYATDLPECSKIKSVLHTPQP